MVLCSIAGQTLMRTSIWRLCEYIETQVSTCFDCENFNGECLCTVHTYTNFNTIDYDFVDLENLNNIFINFVVNRIWSN